VCFRWKNATEAELDRRNAAVLCEILRRARLPVQRQRPRRLRPSRLHRKPAHADADIAAVVEEVMAAAAAAA